MAPRAGEVEKKAENADVPPSDDQAPGRRIEDEYTQRYQVHAGQAAALGASDARIANGRLWTVVAAGILAWMAFGLRWLSPWWLLVPLVAFIVLLIRHEHVVSRLDGARRRAAFYAAGLRRLTGRWAGKGTSGARFADPGHPYADDLDLFGPGSLFELLCTARTAGGEEALASWLTGPADAATVHARQAAVTELRPRLDLRESLSLLGENVRARIAPSDLVSWGMQPPLLPDGWTRPVALVLSGGAVLALIGWGLGYGYLPVVVVGLLGRLLAWRLGGAVARVVRAVDQPARDLGLLSSLLGKLETEPFGAPLLKSQQAAVRAGGAPPSARIERLQTLVGSLEARKNPFLAGPLGLLLWTIHCAFGIERWRSENGRHVGGWLEAVGEFEALCALAGYAYEHPDDPFPALVESAGRFAAEGLRHPLLPGAIPCDVSLDDGARLYIVSGSNMSGKSTLLRSVGVNVVLALAGAPVRARAMRLAPVHLGASIRTNDSLQGGVSRFYAEITRLRQVVEVGRTSPPLLFLLDEILHGTNSHDRRIGAEAVVRTLLREGGFGLLTTHDLALSALADDPGLGAVNVHFEDQMVDGRMDFDYQLRPGVVERSNAIALMRAVGLDI